MTGGIGALEFGVQGFQPHGLCRGQVRIRIRLRLGDDGHAQRGQLLRRRLHGQGNVCQAYAQLRQGQRFSVEVIQHGTSLTPIRRCVRH